MRGYTFRELFATTLNLLPASIQDTFPSVLFGRLLVIATRLGIFEALQDRRSTVHEIAEILKLPEKSVRLMLSPLEAMGYLKCASDRFSLAPQASKWLVKSSPHYIGNFIAYIELLHRRWMDLEDTLRLGTSAKSYVDSFTPAEWKVYTLGMMDLAKLLIPHVIQKINIPPTCRSVVDVCGSHGSYSIALLREYPHLSATILDLPQVLDWTRGLIADDSTRDRIKLISCDVAQSDFPEINCNTVLLCNAIHGFSDEVNAQLIRRIASWLSPGGSLYILDQLREDRTSGVDRMLPLMVGLNLLNEIGGNVYEFADVKKWCSDAGFLQIRSHRIGLPGVRLVEAISA